MESLKRQITALFNARNFISDLDIVYFCNTFIECRYFRGCTRSFDGEKTRGTLSKVKAKKTRLPWETAWCGES